MTDSRPPDDPAWERLLEFALVDDEALTDEEVRELLAEANIDTGPAVKHVLESVRRSRARAALANAGKRRTTLLARFNDLLRDGVDTATQGITQFIRERIPVATQAAYFRKLEQAATEDDLRALARDLALLELMDDEAEDLEG